MGRLRTEEVRRLLRYLSERVEDPERLAGIEDALRDEDAEEFLREPDLLTYFPEQTVEIAAVGAKWRVLVSAVQSRTGASFRVLSLIGCIS